MTLDEAFAELGIDHDAGAAEARRAYLKLLKLRKPETDPQGFMRLREAYELAKARLEAREAFFGPMGATRPEPPREAPVRRQPAPAIEAEPAADVEPPAAQPDASEAPEVPPDASEAPVASADALEAPPDDEPDAPPPDEPVAVAEPLADEATLRALLAEGRHAQAAEEMARIFDAAAQRTDGPPPPVHDALELLVALHAENEIEPAEELHDSLTDWLRASGQEVRVLRGDAAARWSLLRELAALPAGFPGAVRGAIGRAMQAGDVTLARTELAALRRRTAKPAREAAAALRAKAPLLAKALADALEPPAPSASAAVARPAPQRSSKGGWAMAAVIIGALRVILLLARGTSSSPSYHDPSRYLPTQYNLPSLAADGGRYLTNMDGGLSLPAVTSKLDDLEGRVRHRAESTRSHAEYVLAEEAGRRRVDYRRVATDADAVASAVARKDCTAARAAMKTLKTRMSADSASPDELGRVEVQTFERALTAYCAELSRTPGPGAGAKTADAGRCGGTDDP